MRGAVLIPLCLLVGLSGRALGSPVLDRLLIIAPAAPGGGWDQTARTMQQALQAEGLVRVVEVQNVAGAAGTIGLAQFVDTHRADGHAVLISGLVMLGAILWNDSPVSLTPLTPIARLAGEFEVVAVPSSSPYRSIQQLIAAFRSAPDAVSWGGGSAGGTDHILAGLMASAAGIDPRRVNYIAFSGGGEAVTALMGGNVTAGVSGYSEFAPHFASGRLRALAASGPQAASIPTLRASGLDVELANWRAVMAAPEVSNKDRRLLAELVERMVRTPTWRKALADRQWTDIYLGGDEFAKFLDTERVRVSRIVARLREPGGHGAEPIRFGRRAFPIVILGGFAMLVIMLVRQLYADPNGGSEGGFAANTGAMAFTVLGLALFLGTFQLLGFVVAGTALFVCVARGLESRTAGDIGERAAGKAGAYESPAAHVGRRTWGRALAGPLLVGFVFCTLVYLAFTRGLDLALPSGTLWAWTR
jgi:putative tricarboxylic transport membrane protein